MRIVVYNKIAYRITENRFSTLSRIADLYAECVNKNDHPEVLEMIEKRAAAFFDDLIAAGYAKEVVTVDLVFNI